MVRQNEDKMTNWPQISVDVEGGYSLCFGCGQDNPIGLKLSFQWDGETARAEFTPTEFYQGWPGLVHGGIIICMLDEAMAYAALFEGMNCVTAKMQVKLSRPASIDEPLVITSSVAKKTRKLVETRAAVSLKDGTPVAEGKATQFVVNSPDREDKSKAMPGSNTKAVIWDMDGVIADTAPYHLQAWQEVFSKRGVRFTEGDFRESFGLRNDTIVSDVLGEETSQEEMNAVASEKEESFRWRIRRDLKPLPGVIKLMKSLTEGGFSMALASSAPMENIRLLTEGLGIAKFFQCIISEKDVTEGKPSPQGFLLAAQKLGVEPKNCIVIEDAVAGVAAAKRAGMHCLAVTNTHPKTSLTEADLIVNSLRVVTVNDLEGLLKS